MRSELGETNFDTDGHGLNPCESVKSVAGASEIRVAEDNDPPGGVFSGQLAVLGVISRTFTLTRRTRNQEQKLKHRRFPEWLLSRINTGWNPCARKNVAQDARHFFAKRLTVIRRFIGRF